MHGGLGNGARFEQQTGFGSLAQASKFIAVLITQLGGRYDIGHHRVFVTGHSNGAMLGERLACQLSGPG
jgi:poly(3-hydroxybutyrate) depolymerase